MTGSRVPLPKTTSAGVPSAAVPPVLEFATSHGPASVFGSYRDLEPDLWAATFSGRCKDARFYEVVADSLAGKFDHRYLVLARSSTGERFIQPMFLVDQDVFAGLPGVFRTLITAIRRGFPRFGILKMLMVGNAVGEGDLACVETWAIEALREALDRYGRQCGASIVLFKDFPAEYRQPLQRIEQFGFQRVPSMPGAGLTLSYRSFEDYLERKVGKVFRKNLRRKFRQAGSHPELTLEVVKDATPWADEVFRLYHQTFARAQFQFEELTSDYFQELGRRLPDKVRFFLWRQSGRLIAVSICMVHEGTLHDLELGLDYTVAFDLHLYYLTWRDIVQWAIDHNLQRYQTGPLNYDPKLHLRLDLRPLDLYAKHTSAWLNPFFGMAMKYLQPVRHHPILARFPNAHEL